MNDTLPSLLQQLSVDAGPLAWQRLKGGRNSEVHQVYGATGQWILKRYFTHPQDQRDRLGTEFSFLRVLNAAGLPQVAQALACDPAEHCALYSRLPGTALESVGIAEIDAAAAFIIAINRCANPAAASKLAPAADAASDDASHMALAERRLQRLAVMPGDSAVHQAARAFVNGPLQHCWAAVRHDRAGNGPMLGAAILSPSDFGFHNALRDDGQLYFVDFEYAGWDDPVKLMCDFQCQPALAIDAAQGQAFCEQVVAGLGLPLQTLARVARLLPVHRVKWCAILLNEFLDEARARRLHAGIDDADLLGQQLNKAETYFRTYLSQY